ncbi:unnamed protein product [Chrysoparadoxa australica]
MTADTCGYVTPGGISFRQAGRSTQGKVLKPRASKAQCKTIPSIPSKQMAWQGSKRVVEHQKDGFGMRGARFTEYENDLPGPGVYYRPVSLLRETVSVSKKGCGSLVSKSRRFSNAMEEREARLPGPGSYSCEVQPVKKLPGHCSSSFSKKPDSGALGRNTCVPGPGHYSPEAKSRLFLWQMHKPSAEFISRSARSTYLTPSSTPAPGEYEPDIARIGSEGKKSRLPQASFRSVSKRGREFDGNSKIPGPGQYDISRAAEALRKDRAMETKASSAFAGSERTRHFGERRDEGSLPGPGWYAVDRPEGTQSDKAKGSAAFKSTTMRAVKRAKALPGPAFYNPASVTQKKSFHLNINQKWI